MSATISTYVPSLGATATRNADILPLPFLARPQAMTGYVRFVEMGTILAGGRIWQIGSSSNLSPRLIVFETVSAYRIHHQTLNGTVAGSLAVAPSIGDVVELVCQLDSDGSVTLIQSVNGAASTDTDTSAALTLANAWSAQFIHFNSVGSTSVGFIGLRNLVFHRGVQSLETMRRLAGV